MPMTCQHVEHVVFGQQWIFIEEGNSSCRNVQYNILASVNFLYIFLFFNMPGYTPNIFKGKICRQYKPTA